MAGVAGVIQSLSVNTGSPVFGENIVLIAIAAVVIGGTRPRRRSKGRPSGTLGGLLTIACAHDRHGVTKSVPAYVQATSSPV